MGTCRIMYATWWLPIQIRLLECTFGASFMLADLSPWGSPRFPCEGKADRQLHAASAAVATLPREVVASGTARRAAGKKRPECTLPTR